MKTRKIFGRLTCGRGCGWKMAGAAFLVCAAMAIAAPAQTFKFTSFDGTDGNEPVGSLIQGSDGRFYGTTEFGGSSGYGTVFRISSGGTLTALYSFCAEPNCTDGSEPYAGLVLATDGSYYGTTSLTDPRTNVGGTVFKITSDGTLTTLYTFCAGSGPCPDGCNPWAGLVQGADGNFYGTASEGGSKDEGTVFGITPKGAVKSLYSFNNSHGSFPTARVIQATDGNFYGTTYQGGANSGEGAVGGTVFRITPAGDLTTLYSFCALADCADGQGPSGALVQGTDGNLYGTTAFGGDAACKYGCGTVFQLTLGGTLTTLHSFKITDGDDPVGGLLQGTDGIFYGTASGGGTASVGTVFSLDMGLGPFVSLVHGNGMAGQEFGILGQGLTGTSSVSINGTAVSFTVKADTSIVATVPSGATTGYVTVTTPSGTLTSNVPFNVFP